MEDGTIEGHVTDMVGDVLPGVVVAAESEAMQGARTTVTDAEGRYRLTGLPPGSYDVTFEMPGFDTAEKTCRVEEGEASTCDAALKIAEPEES